MQEFGGATSASEFRTSSNEYNDRKLWMTLWIFLAAGTFFTLVNRHWPIARNGLCYAKAALGIIEHHFNLFAIVHDRTWTSGKPIFFSTLAAPLVWLFNANIGTILASFIGTTFFLWMTALTLPRLNRLTGLNPSVMPLELVLVAFNPLVLYQFWSAYPDSLFAGLVMLAFVLTEAIATEPERDTRWHILGLGVTIYLAIHTKLYGAVLLLTCPLYLLMHARHLVVRSSHRVGKVGIFVAVWAILGLVLVAAKLNVNPLLDFAEGGGFGGYVGGVVNANIRVVYFSLSMLVFAVLLVFQASLLFLAPRAAWRAWMPAPTLFVGIYALGLLTFPGTDANMRYFLPVFPFLVPGLAAGARWIRPRARQAILAAYTTIACVLVLSFNLASVERMVEPVLSTLSTQYAPLRPWMDNLRLPVQIALKQQIDAINTNVAPGSTLYWSSDYYGTATHGLAEHLGVKHGLEIRYVLEPFDVKPSPGPVFLTAFTSAPPPDTLWQAPGWATVKNVGNGLFRLDPISVELESLSGDYVEDTSPIRLLAKVKAGDHIKVGSAEFIESETIVGLSRQRPFEVTWKPQNPGRHEIVARISYGERDTAVSESVVYVGVPALERAAKTNDMAWEGADGVVWRPDETLLMATELLATGIRFENLNVPKGAHIANSYLELTAAHPDSKPTTLEIQGELCANGAELKFENGNLSQRRRTTTTVNWVSKPWTLVGEKERSPNLAPILEEVFAQAGWQPGNALVLLLRSFGLKFAQLPDQDGRGAPRLYIELRQE